MRTVSFQCQAKGPLSTVPRTATSARHAAELERPRATAVRERSSHEARARRARGAASTGPSASLFGTSWGKARAWIEGGQGARRRRARDRGDGARRAPGAEIALDEAARRPRAQELERRRCRVRRRAGHRRGQAAGAQHDPVRRDRDATRSTRASARGSSGAASSRAGSARRWASCTASTRRRAASSSSRAPGSPSRRSTSQFRQHTVHRRYLAIAHGDVPHAHDPELLPREPRRRPARLGARARVARRRRTAREAITHVDAARGARGRDARRVPARDGSHAPDPHPPERVGQPPRGRARLRPRLPRAAPRGAAPDAPRRGARRSCTRRPSARCAGSGPLPDDMRGRRSPRLTPPRPGLRARAGGRSRGSCSSSASRSSRRPGTVIDAGREVIAARTATRRSRRRPSRACRARPAEAPAGREGLRAVVAEAVEPRDVRRRQVRRADVERELRRHRRRALARADELEDERVEDRVAEPVGELVREAARR